MNEFSSIAIQLDSKVDPALEIRAFSRVHPETESTLKSD